MYLSDSCTKIELLKQKKTKFGFLNIKKVTRKKKVTILTMKLSLSQLRETTCISVTKIEHLLWIATMWNFFYCFENTKLFMFSQSLSNINQSLLFDIFRMNQNYKFSRLSDLDPFIIFFDELPIDSYASMPIDTHGSITHHVYLVLIVKV